MALLSSASGTSWPSFVVTTTSCLSRFTTTPVTAGCLRRLLSMPCAQKPQTMPNTFISMVDACAAAPARHSARKIPRILMARLPRSEIDHGAGAHQAIGGGTGLDPDALLEEAQQHGGLGAFVQIAGVVAGRDHQPGGQ